MSRYAFVDVDGTLTTGPSSWELVHQHFDLVDKMEDHSDKFYSGQISYEEWAELDVALWKGKPYSELHKALNPPNLIKGAKEGIGMLKSDGYHVVLLSGGIDVMVNEVMNLVGADQAFANTIGHTDGILNGTVGATVGIKSIVINELVRSQNIDLDQTVAIGDNVNDIEMFELSGRTLAINPKSPKIEDVADQVVITDNFVDAVSMLVNNT